MNKIVYAGKHSLTMRVSCHLHNSWELIYCTSGRGQIIANDRHLDYETDDIAIIPALTPHSNISEKGFTNIHINLVDTTLVHTEPLIFPGDSNRFLRDAFSAAFFYFSEGSAGYHSLIPIYGNLIVAFLTLAQPGSQQNETIQQIANNILQNYPDSGYDLNAYLDSLPFSTEYLKKQFKKATGLTPHQYLTDKRLENAASTLATLCGKGNISETARLCGFSDPLYFSRIFKKKYGVAPRDYISEYPIVHSDAEAMKVML